MPASRMAMCCLRLTGETINETTLYFQLRRVANRPVEIGLMREGYLEQVTLSRDSATSETNPEEIMFGLMWQTSLSGMQLTSKQPPITRI